MSLQDRDYIKDHPFDRRMAKRRRMDRDGSIWKEAILMLIFLAMVIGGVSLLAGCAPPPPATPAQTFTPEPECETVKGYGFTFIDCRPAYKRHASAKFRQRREAT